MTDYAAACRKEIAAARLQPASSIFFGGGTPSLLPGELLVSILQDIDREPDAEITVECNPDTVTSELFATYAQAGINRVSLGVQSMVPSVLQTLGREHNPDNVAQAVRIAHEQGIQRVNVDLIYGGAGESVEDWRRSVEAVLALDPMPTHVSAYGLTVEPGTPLALDIARHPNDDDQADKYIIADELFTAVGLRNYEISNWAKLGDECRHNVLYWRQENYQGIGCAAHSHKDGRRWWNIRTPDRYIAAVEAGESTEAAGEDLDPETRRFEALELAMRMHDGVPAEVLPIDELEGFVRVENGRAILTQKGRLMANEIATKLIV